MYSLLSAGMYTGFLSDSESSYPKKHPDYKNENTLFREMVSDPTLPEWAETVIIIGDSAYGSEDNMKPVQKMDKEGNVTDGGFPFLRLPEPGKGLMEKV